MSLGKQAKILTKPQAEAVLSYLGSTRYPVRNRVVFLLSLKAGLRAKEIAALTWEMVTDAEGRLSDAIHLTNVASKGRSGRVIPINNELREALAALRTEADGSVRPSPYLISSERGAKTSAAAIVNKFAGWYSALGFSGASSHSGRRTFITNAARKISTVGGSLRDVQLLAGHTALSTTQRYIDSNGDAQRRIVNIL
jgi:integrase